MMAERDASGFKRFRPTPKSAEVFIPIKPQATTRKVIDQINAIIEEYARQDFTLTLRQLYYQFVARDLLEENTLAQYKAAWLYSIYRKFRCVIQYDY
jgi:hypothetical protein